MTLVVVIWLNVGIALFNAAALGYIAGRRGRGT